MNAPLFVTLTDPQRDTRFFELLKELRPHLNFPDFLYNYHEAKIANHYELVGLEEQGQLMAIMGYRIIHDFVHGKHLYIDDLVTSSKFRSKGYGAILLKHAEELAQERSCSNLRLCTGIENEKGKSFYEKNDWKCRAVVFKKKL